LKNYPCFDPDYHFQALSLLKRAEKVLVEDDTKVLFEKGVAELEQSNAQLKLDLERSSKAPATLQSSYDKKMEFCEGLRTKNLTLHKDGQHAKSRALVLEVDKEKLEKFASESIAAATERY
jgi:hypothetical protein